jgi:anaerobic selenocysteine-containing dehydrogenase
MCLHGCGIKVYVENGVALKIEGDTTNLDNMGKLCPKGNAGLARLYDPDRIRKPMKRTNPEKGPDIDPGWVEIEWEEALETTARELGKIRKDDPRKLLAAIGDFQRIMLWGWPAVFGSPNFFSTIGNYCGGSYHPVNGAVDGSFAAINDYEYCNYWIQIGSGDGFSSHLHVSGSSKRMADARMRGMKVVALDPRCSVAAAKADEWIPTLPGTDRAFVLGMAHVLVHELERFDHDFLRDRTNAPYLVREDGFYLRDGEERAQVWDTQKQAPGPWDDTPAEHMALDGTYTVDGETVRVPGLERHPRGAYAGENVRDLHGGAGEDAPHRRRVHRGRADRRDD